MEKTPLFKKLCSVTRMMWWRWSFSTTNALSQFTDCHFESLNSKPYGSQSSFMAEMMLLISAGTGADVGRQSASHLPSLFCLRLRLCNPRVFVPFHQKRLLFSWSTFKSPLPAEQLWQGSQGSESLLPKTADANLGNYFIRVQGVVLVKTSFENQMLYSTGNFLLQLNTLLLTLKEPYGCAEIMNLKKYFLNHKSA